MTTSTPEQPWRRGFWSLIVTQFQGAFSDNALKQLALFMGISLGMKEHEQDQLSSLTIALLTLPFIFFSMFGGALATRYSKRDVTIAVKVFEIFIMILAAIGLAQRNLVMVLGCVFCMGVHSAIFGPSKYGSLPELLPEKRLSWGNGILELGTFLAIILGTVGGSMLSVMFEGAPAWAGVALLGLAALGLATSFGITRISAADPAHPIRVNFLGDLRDQCRVIRRDHVLKMAVIGNTFFWFLAGLLFLNLFTHGRFTLACDKQHISYLQAALAIGIGIGSVGAGYLSGGKIEYGLVPLGLIGMTVFSALLGRSALGYQGVLWHVAGLGFFAGFYAVPVNAIMQHRPRKEDKAGVLAAANLISSAGTFLSSGVYYLLRVWPHDTGLIFLVGAGLALLALVYTLVLMPDSLLRLLLWIFTHSIYRIRVEGRDNIPERGGALFVCNHVSFVDALLVQAATDRPLRCIIFKDIYEHPLVKPFAKIARHIPISSQQRPRELIKSLNEAREAILNGEVIVIFAEGQITRIGQLLPFRRGFERIMKDVTAPIIPICLDHVWGSIFSYEKGRFLWKMPRYIPYPVTVSFGKPLPPTASPFEVRQAVQELNTEAWAHRRKLMLPIHRGFVRKARHHPLRFFMADARVPKLRFGPALTRTILLARRLRAVWADQEMVGILMPPSVAGALVNYAALLMGKVPVNLNYTISNEALISCASQCSLKTVVTSRVFLEKAKVNAPAKAIYVEALALNVSVKEKLMALLMTWTLPVRLLERSVGGRGSVRASAHVDLRPPESSLDKLATIIFSSGSTGDPKGVMLTHFNIISNAEQLEQTFAFSGRDRILGILPFFHSFGFTGTLIVPAVLGIGVVYHVSPLDAKAIGALVRKYRVTFLLATPTFLQMYIRSCEPEDFGSLQFVMTGAEKLPERVAQAFEDKFGIRPLEAYGLTECSPAVTVNTHDFRAAGFRQVGAKRGKIGHPLPGISVRIVDPETFAPKPVGEPGMLLVRGPNVMQGYLGRPEKTAEVFRDGWYITGDVAALDEDGFLQITDRLTRFSKIGGEMIPHIKVEEKLHELAGATEQCFVVTGVPDEKKGERLVVLHTIANDKLKPVLDKLAASDLPNLWKPRPDQFFRVDSLPHLGTGKLDLRKLREMAASR